jgi:hypothetical protein
VAIHKQFYCQSHPESNPLLNKDLHKLKPTVEMSRNLGTDDQELNFLTIAHGAPIKGLSAVEPVSGFVTDAACRLGCRMAKYSMDSMSRTSA